MSEPFDPFSYEDEQDEPSKAATEDTSKTANTTNKRKQPQDHQNVQSGEAESIYVSLEELPFELSRSTSANKRLPPKLNVKLSYHEEVSSNSIEEKDSQGRNISGGSFSRLFVTGKITVSLTCTCISILRECNYVTEALRSLIPQAQVESTDSNQNAPFRIALSGPMSRIAKFVCHEHCVPLTTLNDNPTDNKIKSFKVHIPKSLEQKHIATYSIENVQTQNMPILLQTKATIHNNTTCRISIQIRSNLSNKGDLHDFIIVLSIPSSLQENTVKITRGTNGEVDEMKGIVTWKIGHLGHGKSNLVSVEAELNDTLLDMVRSIGAEAVGEKIDFPVLVRCSSGMDQISDVALTCGSLKECPASVAVQIVKSFRLIHRVCKGGV